MRTGCTTPGANSVKVKGVITWVGAAEVRLYDRLFLEEMPDAGGKGFIEALNPETTESGHYLRETVPG